MATPTYEKLRSFALLTIACLVFLTEFNHAARCDNNGKFNAAFRRNSPNEIHQPKSFDATKKHRFFKPTPESRSNASGLLPFARFQQKFQKVAERGTTFSAGHDAETSSYWKRGPPLRNARRNDAVSNWDEFQFDRFLRYQEIIEYTRYLVRDNPHAKLFEIGTTSEGRPIVAVKIGLPGNNPSIVIDAGMHPREWAAPMAAVYVIKRILHRPRLYEKITYYVVPNANPDGYEYTHTTERLWRKTRSRDPKNPFCQGADANRNFNSHWNEQGTSDYPCSEVYAGRKPFSEPESRAIRDLLLDVEPVMYLSFHSYGGYILHPWGFTDELPPNWEELLALGKKASDAVAKRFNTKYIVGSSTRTLYPASGGSDDWAMEKAGIRLVYTIELEDYGTEFQLPRTMLRKVVQQAYTILSVFVRYVEKL